MNIDINKYITVTEAVRLYRASRSVFYQAAHRGAVEHCIIGGRLMLLKESVDKWRSMVDEKHSSPLAKEFPVRMSERLYDDLQDMVAKMGVSLTAYCRMAIQKQIEEDQKNG